MIERNAFEASCRHFISHENIQRQGWKYIFDSRVGKGYLKMITERKIIKLNENSIALNCLSDYEEEEINDDSIIDTPVVSQMARFEYHVAYNEIFKVPVLLFNVYHHDMPLKYDQILKIFVGDEHDKNEKHWLPNDLNQYTFITQGEHPVLNTVFFYLHPCQTAELMSLVMNGNFIHANYIASWLSFFGRAVNIDTTFHKDN